MSDRIALVGGDPQTPAAGARTILITGLLGLVGLGACAVSFPEAGYRVTNGTGGGTTCDETAWFCANDQTYCSCTFVTPAEAAHPTQVSTPTCNNDAFDGVPWACWATSTVCTCGPANATTPARPAGAVTVSDCCGATGACTEPPDGLVPPATCP